MKNVQLICNVFVLISLMSCREYISKETTNYQYFDISKSDTVFKSDLMAVSEDEYLEYGANVAFISEKGDTAIPFGKYAYLGTDTLTYYANVLEHPNDTTWGRMIAIDRNENVLFDLVIFDNGPDYFSEGMVRVLRNGKMGFANRYGQVVIPCVYDYVKSFNNGMAEVTFEAKEFYDLDQHLCVSSDEWFMIDKKGDKQNDVEP